MTTLTKKLARTRSAASLLFCQLRGCSFLSPQADAIYDMIGFPEFILDDKELDDVYDGV